MKSEKYRRKIKADAIVEYALILGIISAALIAMNVYMQRGIQGKFKDMTDGLISPYQLVQVDPATSSTDTDSEATVESQLLLGGGTKYNQKAKDTLKLKAEIEDREIETPQPFHAEGGYTGTIPYGQATSGSGR